ncbi:MULTISPECIES: oligosaccharide flippase family protein [unclassified Dysgonomonas]|nr:MULTISPECIES: oligosaccharide flippase family protein [unclassified Dysgonomonas]MDR2003709.1 oligosaccharide flippase family protein [Prevotella sp.]HMM01551.1 oligosaccharide flippase family protein [Dysgonomonas sp.]
MMSLQRIYKSSLFKNTSIYIVTDALNKAIPFLLLPFLTHYLLPEDYGVITNFNVIIQILSVFCYSCTVAALPVMYYKLNKDELRLYVSNIIILNTAITVVVSVLLIIFNGLIYGSLQLSLLYQLVSLIVVWFSSLTYVNLVLWRCEERPLSFGKYQISQSIFSALSTILLVIVLLMGWQGRVYSYLISAVVFGLVSLYVLKIRGFLELSVSKKYMTHALFFALPLVPHALSFWLKSGVDKILLTDMCSLTENGLYSVAMTLGSIVTMVLLAFNNAYAPYLYKKLTYFDDNKNNIGMEKDKVKLVKLTYSIVILALVLVFFAYWISWFIIKYVYDISYSDSIKFLPYVMIGQFFYGGYLMFVCYFHHTFRTKLLGTITFLLSMLQIAMSYLFIKWIDSTGVAIASAVVSFLTFFFVAIFAMKIYQLPWLFFINKKNE